MNAQETPRQVLSNAAGCGYHIFAGKECSRALALMSLKPEDCNSKLDDLDQSKIKILDDWQKVHFPAIGTDQQCFLRSP